MKIKTEIKPINVYVCEVCEKEFPDAGGATWCETTHAKLACKHTNLTYSIDIEDDYGDKTTCISANCHDCKKDEVEKYQICDYLLSKTVSKEIFEIVKKEITMRDYY